MACFLHFDLSSSDLCLFSEMRQKTAHAQAADVRWSKDARLVGLDELFRTGSQTVIFWRSHFHLLPLQLTDIYQVASTLGGDLFQPKTCAAWTPALYLAAGRSFTPQTTWYIPRHCPADVLESSISGTMLVNHQ